MPTDYNEVAKELGWDWDEHNSEYRKADLNAPDGYRYAATAEHAVHLNSVYFYKPGQATPKDVFEARKATLDQMIAECSLRDVLQMIIEICDDRIAHGATFTGAWVSARDFMDLAQTDIIENTDENDENI